MRYDQNFDINHPDFMEVRHEILSRADYWHDKDFWKTVSVFKETAAFKKALSERLLTDVAFHHELVTKVPGFQHHKACALIHSHDHSRTSALSPKDLTALASHAFLNTQDLCHFNAYVYSNGSLEVPLSKRIQQNIIAAHEVYYQKDTWNVIKDWEITREGIVRTKNHMLENSIYTKQLSQLKGPDGTRLDSFIKKEAEAIERADHNSPQPETASIITNSSSTTSFLPATFDPLHMAKTASAEMLTQAIPHKADHAQFTLIDFLNDPSLNQSSQECANMATHLSNSSNTDPNAPQFNKARMNLLLRTDWWRYKSYWDAVANFNETPSVKKIFSNRLQNEPLLHSGLVQNVAGFKNHTACAHVHANGPLINGRKLSKNACIDLQTCGCSHEEVCHFGAYVRSEGKLEQPLAAELRKKICEHFEVYKHPEIWDAIKSWPETAKTVLNAKLDMVRNPNTIAKLHNLTGPNKAPLNEFFQKISLNLQPNDIPEVDTTYFDLSIGTKVGPVSEINNYIRELKHVKGALGTDGPLMHVLTKGLRNYKPAQLDNARGSLYHLAKAYRAKLAGKNIIQFEAECYINGTKVSFDIEFDNLLVECKNTLWNEFKGIGDLNSALLRPETNDAIKKLLINIENKQLLAKQLGKQFEIWSNHSLPENLKSWLNERNILFIDGECGCSNCFI